MFIGNEMVLPALSLIATSGYATGMEIEWRVTHLKRSKRTLSTSCCVSYTMTADTVTTANIIRYRPGIIESGSGSLDVVSTPVPPASSFFNSLSSSLSLSLLLLLLLVVDGTSLYSIGEQRTAVEGSSKPVKEMAGKLN